MKKVMETSMAVAQAVKLCRPATIPMYPITPQTHIVENIAQFINDGELSSDMIHVESEHSAISAALGSSATGVRTFTATASQGLALMHEILHITSGMRLPVVMAVANRALSAPINIWNDHQDSMSARDTGWIQLYVESAQEALDTMIQAFRIAENKKVLLPAMVCIDGFTLSHVYEPVEVPQIREVGRYLPKFSPPYKLDPKKPITMGPVGFPDSFMTFKKQEQDAMTESLNVIRTANKDFKRQFKRGYGNGLIEEYKMSDAEHAIITMGSLCGTTRDAVDELRENGKKVGLLKIRTYRPFPADEIKKATKNLKSIVVIEKNISLGHEGAVYSDLRSTLYDTDIIINGYIAGLGGKDITAQHIKDCTFEKKQPVTWM
ncbi:MAG: transketolase C-terminal domain-containing protein [Candidatus Woesearchaeota archaeon]